MRRQSQSLTPEELAKRCQVGVPRGPGAYDELHEILAACYGTISRLQQENERLRRGEFICTRCGLRWSSGHEHPIDF